jgi:glutamine amidotransferase
MKIVIIDYGAGNIQSIQFAIERLGFVGKLTDNITEITNADKVIFPGVGEASSAMKKLIKSGLIDVIKNLKQPVLGICLGMQLMCKSTAEGNTEGLGIFDVDVVRFSDRGKVPQMGWNNIFDLKSKLFTDIYENEFMYMVHSFYAPICKDTIANSEYNMIYSSALQKNNFFGVQFHPEKSGIVGEKILANFINF